MRSSLSFFFALLALAGVVACRQAPPDAPPPAPLHAEPIGDAGATPPSAHVAIQPNATYTYRFRLRQSGTYWYHSHSSSQEQAGMYGAIVIEPARPETTTFARDYVVLLSDHSREAPQATHRGGGLDRQDSAFPGAYYDPDAYARSIPPLFDYVRSHVGFELFLLHDIHERLAPIDALRSE